MKLVHVSVNIAMYLYRKKKKTKKPHNWMWLPVPKTPNPKNICSHHKRCLCNCKVIAKCHNSDLKKDQREEHEISVVFPVLFISFVHFPLFYHQTYPPVSLISLLPNSREQFNFLCFLMYNIFIFSVGREAVLLLEISKTPYWVFLTIQSIQN